MSGSVGDPELLPIHLIVADRYEGWRLDHFVQACFPRLSRNRIQKMLRAQQDYSGQVLRPAQRVRRGQTVDLLRPAPDEPELPRDYRELFRDEHLLALDKPAGLPVHATARYLRNTLTAVLRERFSQGEVPTLCHRLDRETSGVLLLARKKPAEIALKADFFHRRIHKRYLAIVDGDPGVEGQIDARIGPDPMSRIRLKMAVVGSGGQDARTRFIRLERRGRLSLIEVRPETGRQHQIRVHLAHLGTPVVGDKLYGPDSMLMLEYLETGWTEALAERLLLPRQALHAVALEFVHPETEEAITVTAPLAEDLRRFWDELG